MNRLLQHCGYFDTAKGVSGIFGSEGVFVVFDQMLDSNHLQMTHIFLQKDGLKS